VICEEDGDRNGNTVIVTIQATKGRRGQKISAKEVGTVVHRI